jgi:indole-3-glycerol phosphate synthase
MFSLYICAMNHILAQIIDTKRTHITAQKAKISMAALHQQAAAQPAPKGFIAAIRTTIAQARPALIAELKKASPSKGLIRKDFNPVLLAERYREGGATCLSVLTDIPYFQGEDAFLQQVVAASPLPALRKDFMIEPYQIMESRALGADAILLIMAALSDAQAMELEATAHELGLDVLVEVHDTEELERALDILKTPLIGINNRNLKTLEVDIATSLHLAPLIPADKIIVCESGIKTHADIQTMQQAGMHTFLVGESLMLHADVTQATKALLGF